MGLDITLYSAKKHRNEDYKEFVINEEVDTFKKYFGEEFINTKINQYYDFDAIGITDDRYEWASTSYGEKDIWEFDDKENHFYKLLTSVETDDEIDPSKLTEDVRKELISAGILDYIKKNNYVVSSEDNLAILDGKGEIDYHYIRWFLNEKFKVIIEEDNIPTKDQEDKVIYGEEIGYQRKGLNDLFYSNFTNEDYYVFTKEKLQCIYDNYVEENLKEYFKKHILDKHVDGQTFVTFDW